MNQLYFGGELLEVLALGTVLWTFYVPNLKALKVYNYESLRSL